MSNILINFAIGSYADPTAMPPDRAKIIGIYRHRLLTQYKSLDKLFILRIVILGCLHMCGIVMWGEDNHDIDLKHKAYINGDTILLSGVEIVGYKDFNGCRIVDNYNIIDSCYMEIGDEKTIDEYHLAILSLSPDEYTGNEERDRILLSIVNGQPRIYDNVLANNGATYSYECERFVFPTEEMASFNCEYDFALLLGLINQKIYPQ